ncbi:MAG: transposase, partial [Ktedonobacteraceae bacterium]|nr:transposase [Ktedonobacteraceae bacterium]
ILRRMMALPTVPVERVSQLGIDDFSFRRGRKFGTILVDMQSHRGIDVLPDRTAETASAWMAAHPEIVLVSRDRGGDSASAASSTAPQAIQCADRFHQAMFLFLRRPEDLSDEEQETLVLLRSLHIEVKLAYELVQQFAHMLRTRTGEQLDDWLCRVKESRIRELQGFVAGV